MTPGTLFVSTNRTGAYFLVIGVTPHKSYATCIVVYDGAIKEFDRIINCEEYPFKKNQTIVEPK